MQIMQSRRDFLASMSAAGAASVLGARSSLADEAPPEITTLRLRHDSNICAGPSVHCGGPAAGGRVHRHPLRSRRSSHGRRSHVAKSTSISDFAAWRRLRSGCRRADHGAGRCAPRLLRAVRARTHPHHQRPEGQEGRHPEAGLGRASAPCRSWRRMSGSTRTRTSTGWQPRSGDFMELFAERKVDAFLGAPPEPQELRARKIGHVILNTTTDKPWSQYFCCTAVRQQGLCPQLSGRHQARHACRPQSRPTSAPPSRSGPHNGWSMAGFTQRYDYALQTLTELPYASWREFDPEELAALLRAAPPRGRHDQVQPEPAHRRRHRLALPQRAQARAEGVRQAAGWIRSARGFGIRKGGFRCRSSNVAAISWPACPLAGGRRRPWHRGASLADEGPPETTTIRHRASSAASALRPQYVAEELLRAEGFTDVRYVPTCRRRPDRAEDRARRHRLQHVLRADARSSLDAGLPITALAGVHPGCFELFAHEPIRTISDLKGKRVGIDAWARADHLYVADHGGARRARPRQGHRLDQRTRRQTRWSCSPRAKSMRSSDFRPSRRSCAPARSVT